MTEITPLPPERLARTCTPEELPFETTDDLTDAEVALGQERALEALAFGVGMRAEGYNLYVLGPSSVDLRHLVSEFLDDAAAELEPPSDWCYVQRFEDPQCPFALALPAGKGRQLRNDMNELVQELLVAIPAAFGSEDYQARSSEIQQDVQQRLGEAFQALQKEAKEKEMALIQTPGGWAVAPIKEDHVLTKEEFDALPEEEQKKSEQAIQEMSDKLQEQLRTAPKMIEEARRVRKELDRQTALIAASGPIAGLKDKWLELADVIDYLDAVSEDVIENFDDFRPQTPGPFALPGADTGPNVSRYEVNLLVDHAEAEGAPVVYETNPTYMNLIGRIEHLSSFGTLITDFTLIRPGALHRANGGFLVLDVDRLLGQPYAWQGLQRVLLSRELRIEALDRVFSLTSTVSLEPDPIPIDLKVVLVGSRLLYYLMSEYLPEFANLFKVAADFEDSVERSEQNVTTLARVIATLCRREELPALERDAVARVIDHLSRRIEDAERFSARPSGIADLLRESSYFATQRGAERIAAADVERAIGARRERLHRIPDRILETIERGILLIATEGEAVGQVNGLSVIQLGELPFGHPTRITATTRLGKGQVIDVQREVELGGAIHSKGVFILSSFLGARYAREQPLALTASLVFEQTYAQVDGDSASVAETCALLSALSGAPLRQDLAVTGSMNQHGRVQAIGGVNEKIEGFFEVCRRRGLTGTQGVLIPRDNEQHLMLRQDVVDAVSEGRFHVYSVSTLDEALSLLSGKPAGEPDEKGRYPGDSVNGLVQARLEELREAARRFAAETRETIGHDE